ncbi:hypothetical protein JCM1393_13560 [Clostridium carnis]
MGKKLIYGILFLVSMFLVIKGNSMVGYSGIAIMLLGMAGLIAELYIYNKRYQ